MTSSFTSMVTLICLGMEEVIPISLSWHQLLTPHKTEAWSCITWPSIIYPFPALSGSWVCVCFKCGIRGWESSWESSRFKTRDGSEKNRHLENNEFFWSTFGEQQQLSVKEDKKRLNKSKWTEKRKWSSLMLRPNILLTSSQELVKEEKLTKTKKTS